MLTALIIAIIITAILTIVGAIVFTSFQKSMREQKNFERGLKMVPLLIHLPPISEDTEAGGRDVRDVVDENISKAQIMYGIIASTLQKGYKSRFYGQRHSSFEIIANHGAVNFYAAVPVTLIDVVKQAVISAYPTARLEEVIEPNIFSSVGKIAGTAGGEMNLKEDFAYPIATYQDVKRDAMQSILNSLSTLENDDGVGIQLLMRPADPGWRKAASQVATNKRNGKKPKESYEKLWEFTKDIGKTLLQGADSSGGKPADKAELSTLDQSIVEAIEDKTRHPGFEVLIRIIGSSTSAVRAKAIVNNVGSSFALFDSQGKNGFKFKAADNVEDFVTAYILRFFPPDRTKNVLNSIELSSIFHFPEQKNIPTSQLERQASKQVDGPRNIPEDGILLGYNVFRGSKKAIRLSIEDRRRHMYLVGQTGVGKSNLLENLALQDMLAGRGFAFVDPHGDTAERLLSMVPKERTEDIIYFCPADMDYPMGINMFEFANEDQKDFLVQEGINMLYKLYDPQHQGIIGPRYEHMFRNGALTIMSGPEIGTFIDLPKVYRDPVYLKEKLQYVTDASILEYWHKEVPQSQRSNEFGEVVSWFSSKFGAFLSNEMMRNIIGQTKSSFNLRDIMDSNKVLLVNLSKGRTGDLNSKLLGMIFVMKFQAAAMSRASVPEDQRKDFCLYVDEFQNFSTDSFATILSEARKYRLNLVVANQFTTQLTDEIKDAVFGNVGSMVAFRVGTDEDADELVKKFQPTFSRQDILRLPNFNTITQVLVNGIPSQPFSMETIPPLGTPNDKLGQALKELSGVKYGRPRKEIEAEIAKRLAIKEQPRPSSTMGLPPPASTAATPPKTGSSFLDEWLTKRKGAVAPAGSGAMVSPPKPSTESVSNADSANNNTPHIPRDNELPKPNDEGKSKHKQHSGEIHLNQRHGNADSTGTDDTIKIDQDGHLTSV